MLKTILKNKLYDYAITKCFASIYSNMHVMASYEFKIGRCYKYCKHEINGKIATFYNVKILQVEREFIRFEYTYRSCVYDLTTRSGAYLYMINKAFSGERRNMESTVVETKKSADVTTNKSGQLIVLNSDLHMYEFLK